MPTYDYKCFACEYVFEEVQKITEDALTICPKCGADKVKRLVSKSSFHLKGGGWYASGYSKSPNSSKDTSKTSSAKKDITSNTAKKETPKKTDKTS